MNYLEKINHEFKKKNSTSKREKIRVPTEKSENE